MVGFSSLVRQAGEGRPVTMVNAYDSSMARLVDRSGVDAILVGDSLGVTMLGYDGTDRVTMDEMVHHAAAVTRSVEETVVVVDLPFGSYNAAPRDAVANATRLKKEGGADAVKLEGGEAVADAVREISTGGIPVVGHLGVTPQTDVGADVSLRGKRAASARRLLDDARAVDDAGASALVLELVAAEAAARITDAVDAFTLGIGAGPSCDGQVLTLHDLLGLSSLLPETAAGIRADFGDRITDHLDRFDGAVRDGAFPGEEATGTMEDGEAARLADDP